MRGVALHLKIIPISISTLFKLLLFVVCRFLQESEWLLILIAQDMNCRYSILKTFFLNNILNHLHGDYVGWD